MDSVLHTFILKLPFSIIMAQITKIYWAYDISTLQMFLKLGVRLLILIIINSYLTELLSTYVP